MHQRIKHIHKYSADHPRWSNPAHRASAAVDGVNPPSRHLVNSPEPPSQHSTTNTQHPASGTAQPDKLANGARHLGRVRPSPAPTTSPSCLVTTQFRGGPQRGGELPRKRPHRSDYSVRPTGQQAGPRESLTFPASCERCAGSKLKSSNRNDSPLRPLTQQRRPGNQAGPLSLGSWDDVSFALIRKQRGVFVLPKLRLLLN